MRLLLKFKLFERVTGIELETCECRPRSSRPYEHLWRLSMVRNMADCSWNDCGAKDDVTQNLQSPKLCVTCTFVLLTECYMSNIHLMFLVSTEFLTGVIS